MGVTITITDNKSDGEEKAVESDLKTEPGKKTVDEKTVKTDPDADKPEKDEDAEQKNEIRKVILEYNREMDQIPGNDDAKRRLQYLCTAEKYRQLDAYPDKMKQQGLIRQRSENILFKDVQIQGKTATADTRERWVTVDESGTERSYETYNTYELTLIRKNWMVRRTRSARLQDM